MASETAANLARDQIADALAASGAHAIAVGQVTRRGRKTFAVIASFARPPATRPKPEVTVTIAGRRVKVPVVVKIAAEFRPE
jgi:Flp pilus assembly protein TadG